MALISQDTVERFIKNGENQVATTCPFLIDRISIPITAESPLYTLPDYILSIRRMTWLGRKITPMSFRMQREFFKPTTAVSAPFWYIFNNVGTKTFKLFPTPSESLPAVNNLWSTGIREGLVIEFYRTPGTKTVEVSPATPWGNAGFGTTVFGSNLATKTEVFQLPPYIRRQLLKQYVAYKSYQIESGKQNMKLSAYFEKKWLLKLKEFIHMHGELFNSPRKLVVSGGYTANVFPGQPMLPIDRYGSYVEGGY